MRFLSSFFILLFLCASWHANAVSANLNYFTFYNEQIGPYIETALLFNGFTVRYEKKDSDMYQGRVNIIIMFKKDDAIVKFSKITMEGPLIKDTTKALDFMDYQRFALPNGVYDMSVVIADALEPEKEFTHEESVTIDFPDGVPSISSIELLRSFERTETGKENMVSKSGYDLIPKMNRFFLESETELSFYSEIYNVGKAVGDNEPFLLIYYVKGFESQRKMNNYAGTKRLHASNNAIPILCSLNISNLISGNYEINIEIRDKENRLIAQNSTFFQRSNPNVPFDRDNLSTIDIDYIFTKQYANIDTLREYISSLVPQASYSEKQYIQVQSKTAELSELQRFLYNFWIERDELNPERAWHDYYQQVLAVNKSFKAGRTKGYQTDRGRVYLQYGPPTIIVDRSFDAGDSGFTRNPDGSSYQDGGTVPYQIWQYDEIGSQKNKRFVFINKHLAAQDYVLIHSDLQGELFNSQWQAELSRSTYNPNLENKQNQGLFDGQSGEYYRVPY